jgi:hypothetical protein
LGGMDPELKTLNQITRVTIGFWRLMIPEFVDFRRALRDEGVWGFKNDASRRFTFFRMVRGFAQR